MHACDHAETHVDRSFGAATDFVSTNVHGTSVLLECVKAFKVCAPHVRLECMYACIVSKSRWEMMCTGVRKSVCVSLYH